MIECLLQYTKPFYLGQTLLKSDCQLEWREMMENKDRCHPERIGMIENKDRCHPERKGIMVKKGGVILSVVEG